MSEPSRPWAALRLLAVAGLDAAALVCCRPAAAALPGRLVQLHRWAAQAGVDRMSATLGGAGLWLVAAWVALGLLAAFAGRLPGAAGRAARRVAARALPRALHRTACAAAGLGVLLSPAAALAGPAGPPAVPPPAWPATAVTAPALPESVPVPTVTVRPGDSLWQIAADRLPRTASARRVAAAWPRWFAANRTVVGSDPNRLVPGEVLQIPKEFRR